MDDTDYEDREGKRGQLVPLPGRCRGKRAHDDRANGATALVDAAGLTPAERAVLFGVPPIDETTKLGDVMIAATGLAKLAAQHVARRLAGPAAAALTGMRPSEAAGLRWSNVDLERGVLQVMRSRHLYEDSATKTASSRRRVELLPETVRVLAAIQPLRVAPDTPVFVNTVGRALEPRAFPHWYACLRALSIRTRGIYSCKDTYISTVLPVKPIPWIEEQTGVSYATLRKHYGRWLPTVTDEASGALDRLAQEGKLCAPYTTGLRTMERQPSGATTDSSDMSECRGGESNP